MSEPLEIRCRENGPYVIKGPVRIVDHLGNAFTIPAGSLSTTVLVDVLEDYQLEWPEYLDVRISSARNAEVGADRTARVWIWDRWLWSSRSGG